MSFYNATIYSFGLTFKSSKGRREAKGSMDFDHRQLGGPCLGFTAEGPGERLLDPFGGTAAGSMIVGREMNQNRQTCKLVAWVRVIKMLCRGGMRLNNVQETVICAS